MTTSATVSTGLLHRISGRWLAGMAVLLATGTANALDTGQRFTDWTVRCETEENQQQRCVIYQTLVNQENEQPVVQFTVGYLGKDGNQPAAIMMVPLGVALKAGVQMQIDDNKAMRVPFDHCIPTGCVAGVPLDQQLIASMKRGRVSKVTIRDITGRTASFDISLSGFTAGFNALR